MKRVSFVSPLLLVLLAGCAGEDVEVTYSAPPEPAVTSSSIFSISSIPSISSISSIAQQPSPTSLPRSVQIQVPFTSQAPTGDWSDPYQEACEEASLLMVHKYFLQEGLSTSEADRQIIELTTWVENKGWAKDITIEQVGQMAEELYGYETKLLNNPSTEDLKQELAAGNPVIVPAAGQMLGNPYFSGDGPPYHMLVITGYTESEFITNDPGTRRGESFKYSYQVLLNSIHDWTGSKETIRNGEKQALVLTRRPAS